MKNFLNKFKYVILGVMIATATTAYAVNVTIPQSPGAGYVPIGNANGTYTPSNSTLLTITSAATNYVSTTTGLTYFTIANANASNTAWLVDTNTTYSASGTLLNLTGTNFSVNAGTLTNTKGCIYTTGTGIVCNSTFLTTYSETDPLWTASSTNFANWNTAYDDRLKWDGGAAGLVAATGRTSLGLGTMALETNTGSTTITTLGTIATGVWSGTAILNAKIASSTEFLSDIYWTGTATNLVAATGRTSLGLGTMAVANTSDYLATGTAATTYQPLTTKLTAISGIATTTGILIQGNGTTFTGISIGTNGQVLTASTTGGAYWATPGSGVTDHALLSNLDYANSGHTGFLSTTTAASTYLTITGASTNYVSTTTGLTYLTSSLAASTYLATGTAASTYFTISGANASNTSWLADTLWSGVSTGLNAATGRASLGLGTMALANTTDYVSTTTGLTYFTISGANASNTSWLADTKWTGVSTDLVAATGRTSLGLGTMALANTTDYVSTTTGLTYFTITGANASNTGWLADTIWSGGSTGLTAATGRTSLGLGDSATLASSTWVKIESDPVWNIASSSFVRWDNASTTIWNNANFLTTASSTLWSTAYTNASYVSAASSTLWSVAQSKVNASSSLWDTSYGWGNHKTGFVGTGVYDFGGVTSLEIWNSAALITAVTGQIGIDTTSDQLRFMGTSATRTVSYIDTKCASLENATGTDTAVPIFDDSYNAFTVTKVDCQITGTGAYATVAWKNNGTTMATSTCTTTYASSTTMVSNSVTSGENITWTISSASGTAYWVKGCFSRTINPD